MSLKSTRCQRGLNFKMNFAVNLQKVSIISMECKTRGYEQMMRGGYVELVLENYSFNF